MAKFAKNMMPTESSNSESNYEKRVVSCILDRVKKRRGEIKITTIGYLNLGVLSLMLSSPYLVKAVNKLDYLYCDGWGALWWLRWTGREIGERATAMDFIEMFFSQCEKRKIKIFFLGSTEKTVKKAVKMVEKKFANLRIVGWHDGFSFLDREMVKKINESKAEIVIIGMSTPKQEVFLARNCNRLRASVGWVVGSLFEYLALEKPHAPRWLGKLGLEWFFRMIVERKRLGKRYLIDYPSFVTKFIFGGANEKRLGIGNLGDRLIR